MGMSSSKAYMPSDARAAEIGNMALATNVVLVPYSILKESKQTNPSLPVLCRGCSSVLNLHSVLHSTEHYNQLMASQPEEPKSDVERAEEEQKSGEKEFVKGQYFKDLKLEEVAWICEFCDVHNRLPSDTVLPKNEREFYLVKRAEKVEKAEETTTQTHTEETKNNGDETGLVFCIDISGSMAVTHQVEGGKYVTRIKLISDAVLKQLSEMQQTSPNLRVGLVEFGSTVKLRGDCSQQEVQFGQQDFTTFEKIENLGLSKGENLITKPLSESFQTLETAINNLETGGGTALGPGLLGSLAMLIAQGRRGSKIILCTDGLANVGIGDLENANHAEQSREFYRRVGDLAASKGVSISIITVKGQACKVDALAPLTDQTAGQILRVDPTNFDLSALAANSLIATHVKVTAIIHEGLAFKGERAEDLKNNNSVLVKQIGNVSDQNEAYFEYRVKTVEELQTEGIDLDKVSSLPLQAQISFVDLDGNERLLVVSRRQQLTKDEKEAEQGIKADILSNYAEKQSANLLLEGKVEEAMKNNAAWSKAMAQAAVSSGDEKNKQIFENYQAQNQQLQQLIGKKADGKLSTVDNDEVTSMLYNIKQKQHKF